MLEWQGERVCVCVCVCVRERERERERGGGGGGGCCCCYSFCSHVKGIVSLRVYSASLLRHPRLACLWRRTWESARARVRACVCARVCVCVRCTCCTFSAVSGSTCTWRVEVCVRWSCCKLSPEAGTLLLAVWATQPYWKGSLPVPPVLSRSDFTITTPLQPSPPPS